VCGRAAHEPKPHFLSACSLPLRALTDSDCLNSFRRGNIPKNMTSHRLERHELLSLFLLFLKRLYPFVFSFFAREIDTSARVYTNRGTGVGINIEELMTLVIVFFSPSSLFVACS
jgi:hypothetical protein